LAFVTVGEVYCVGHTGPLNLAIPLWQVQWVLAMSMSVRRFVWCVIS